MKFLSNLELIFKDVLEEVKNKGYCFRNISCPDLCLLLEQEACSLNLEHEQRFFVRNGIPYSKENQGHPQILYDIAKRIDSPFYSVDLAVNVSKRQWRLVEIGDGQVSEPKKWKLESFFSIFFHP